MFKKIHAGLIAVVILMSSCIESEITSKHVEKEITANVNMLFDSTSATKYLVDGGYGERFVSEKKLAADSLIAKKLLLNRLIEKANVIKSELKLELVEQKNVSLFGKQNAFLSSYINEELQLKIVAVTYPPFGYKGKSLSSNLTTQIQYKGNTYKLNKFLCAEGSCSIGYHFKKAYKLLLDEKLYLLIYFMPSSNSTLTNPVGILLDSNALIKSKVYPWTISRFLFDDFNKDGVLDYVHLNKIENKLQLYSIKNNELVLNDNYYINLESGSPVDILSRETFYFAESGIRWFGPDSGVYGMDAILKDTIRN